MGFPVGTFVIQWQANQDFCIGVQGEPAENSLVVLSASNSPNTTWVLNQETNLIILADNPSFFLSVQGIAPAPTTALCLLPLLAVPNNQKWSWLDDSAIIVLQDFPQLCIDNANSAQQVGNKLQVFTILPGDINQQWQLFPV